MTYYYKGKPYRIVTESKLKFSGILDLPQVDNIDCVQMDWIDVVIYETLYDNPDGKIWVRTKEQFYELFKTEN